jgi:hypothetical protein
MARKAGHAKKNHVKTLQNSFLSRLDCSCPTAVSSFSPAITPAELIECAPKQSAAVQFAPKSALQFTKTDA